MSLLRCNQSLLPAFWMILLSVCSAKPIGHSESHISTALGSRASFQIAATTTTNTQTIDWIPLESQGEVARLPPPRTPRAASRPLSELEQPGASLGPPGTVPISRFQKDYLARTSSKTLPGTEPFTKRQEPIAGTHWYVQNNQSVSNIGGSCIISLFAPYTQTSHDFSLLQTAVVKTNVSWNYKGFIFPVPQTVEAGWVRWDDQIPQPHLFTYFTTNGYNADGDNQGGWNQEQKGFVQVDTKIHPGSVFTQHSVNGGAQYDILIEYNLHQGNWWLAVEDRWVGYYPASLFSNASPDPAASTLAGGSDTIFFYGEVLNNGSSITTTDMGSGEFASKGYTHAGYIFNMTYTDTHNVSKGYNGGAWRIDDPSRYSQQSKFLSGTNRGSYAFIGGPGAGGVVGG